MKSDVGDTVPPRMREASIEALAFAAMGEAMDRVLADTVAATAKPAKQSQRPATPAATSTAARRRPPAVSDSMRSAAIAGWAIIVIFFGGFGAWAVTAPLHGAVVANGFVKVEGNDRIPGELQKEIAQRTDGNFMSCRYSFLLRQYRMERLDLYKRVCLETIN